MLYIIGALIMLTFVMLITSTRRIVDEVPQDQREYMDPPPRFYRLTWVLVRVVSHYCGWAVPEGTQSRIQESLRRAGQDYTLTPVQFFAGKLVASALGAAILAYGTSKVSIGPLAGIIVGGGFSFFLPELWLWEMTKKRNLAILKRLPFFLDIVVLAVESGMNLSSALAKSVEKLPRGPLLAEINRLLREIRAGKPRTDALRDMGARLNFGPISSLVSALVQGEMMGSSIGSILRAQAEQRRNERFQRAEKLALEAPVKMLFPLIFFIFPCTFIVIGFPIVIQFMRSGL
ncbi:MAG: type II secretion system F family protein [Proteobacteria bacterium]|nr:type II secretion system F family protein [Pseudomonadota bacterium]